LRIGRGWWICFELGARSFGELGVALGRGQVQGLLKLRKGVNRFSAVCQRNSITIMGQGVAGSECDRPVKVRNGFSQVPLGGQRGRQITMGLDKIRVDFKRLLVMLDGFSPLPLGGQRDPQINVAWGKSGLRWSACS